MEGDNRYWLYAKKEGFTHLAFRKDVFLGTLCGKNISSEDLVNRPETVNITCEKCNEAVNRE